MMSPPYPSSPPKPSSSAFNGRPISTSSDGNGTPSKPLAHILDLQIAAVKDISVNHSFSKLVGEAQKALNSAETFVQFRRPDLAYQEYLRAFEIVVNIVPRHSDHPNLTGKRGPTQAVLQELIKRINNTTERFENIKRIIVNDNLRNATQPKSKRYSNPPNGQFNTSVQPAAPLAPRSLAGSPVPSAASALDDRFARLRMAPTTDAAGNFNRSESRASLISNGSASSSHDQSPRSSLDISSLPQSLRPAGPRSMPNGGPRALLDTQLAAGMPQAPSPIYSPARNMQIAGNINLPRSSARSIMGTGGRSNAAMSNASSYAPGNEGDDAAGYFPRPSTDRPPAAPPRRKSVHVPKEIRIGVDKLFDYLKMYSILLIDVRTREDFDDGHVFTPSIINIDPTSLRRDMSAEDLQDSMVLAPEAEQSAFSDRNKFDLVVYYDQATSSDRFLSRPSTEREFKLRYLHDALYEFNQEKPLQRPPILLMGGIEAWVELVGDQSLAQSNTASRNKPTRPITRVPVGGSSSRLHVAKRRLREYNPMDADEERKWLEMARKESVAVNQKPAINEEDESQQVEDATPFYDNIEEFVRRFPEAGTIEQRYTMDSPSQPASLQPRIPTYPTQPQLSSIAPPVPPVPSRPVPAASRMSYSGVSERAVSQTNTGSSDHLPAYVPPRFLPSNQRLPRTGLVNFGVTCYMNATIQALSATTPLTLFFLDDRFKQHIQRENWKGSKGVLPELYGNLIRSVWKGDVEAIRPSTLRSFCARLNSEWGIDRQQDAKEFLDFLVDCLHEDLNANWSRTPLQALTDQQEQVREKMPKPIVSKMEWGRYTHRELSYLTELFGGQHASRLRCTTCQFTSTTYEAFYSISVEIPRSGKATIQDCLKSYCAEEMLSGDEVWKCPRCNKEREATKQITITRAPQFLVVHFKRFSAGRGESARKVRTPIEFPLRNFNLEPYMLPSPTPKEQHAMSKNFPPEQLKPDSTMTPPYFYDAYAVMRHIGTTLTSGHYTCLAKDTARNCWRQFNDTWVGDFDPDRLPERDRLQNEMAYIVFFQRVSDR